MSFAETPYEIILFCKTNLGNIKFVILNGTGYFKTDFIYKINQEILRCTKKANPVIVFNNEQNEYCIVCDTIEMQQKYKEWISIDFDVFSKINSATPIELKTKPEQYPYLRIFDDSKYKHIILNFTDSTSRIPKSIIVGSNINTSSISNPSNISILTNISNQFALNVNAKPFVPKARINLKI